MICPRNLCSLKGMELFSFGLRVLFGVWLAYVGFGKWIAGSSGFIGYLSSSFAETWVPSGLTLALGWVILVAEPLLGVWLIIGKHVRCAWVLTTLLMFTLMFGKTILGDHVGVANNWQYTVLALVGASLASSYSCEKASV